MNDLILLLALIFGGQTIGAAAGLLFRPSDKLLRASLAFAAAMMLSLSFTELIPDGLGMAPPLVIVAAFIAGFAGFGVIDFLLPHVHPELLKADPHCRIANPKKGKKYSDASVRRSVHMLIVGMCLHNIPEGLAVGLGFAIDPGMGLMIAFAIALQDIPENLATVVPFYCINKSKKKSFFTLLATVFFELAGFAVGYFLMSGANLEIIGAALAMAAGFMCYISVDELIPSAQFKERPVLASASFAIGVAVVLLLSFLG